jgi:hypothetical protein
MNHPSVGAHQVSLFNPVINRQEYFSATSIEHGFLLEMIGGFKVREVESLIQEFFEKPAKSATVLSREPSSTKTIS